MSFTYLGEFPIVEHPERPEVNSPVQEARSLFRRVGQSLMLAAGIGWGTSETISPAAPNIPRTRERIEPGEVLKAFMYGPQPENPEEVLFHEALLERGLTPGNIPPSMHRRYLDVLIELLDHPSPTVAGYAAWWSGKYGDPRSVARLYEMISLPRGPWGNAYAEWGAEALAYSSKRNRLAASVYANEVLGNDRIDQKKAIHWSQHGQHPLEKPLHEHALLVDEKLTQMFADSDDMFTKQLLSIALINRGPKAEAKHVDAIMERMADRTILKGPEGQFKEWPAQSAIRSMTFFSDHIRPQQSSSVIGQLLRYAELRGNDIDLVRRKGAATFALSRQDLLLHKRFCGNAITVLKDALASDNRKFACQVGVHIAENPHINGLLFQDLQPLLRSAPKDIQRKIATGLSKMPSADPRMLDTLQPFLSGDRGK